MTPPPDAGVETHASGMSVAEALKRRTSVRAFSDRPIPISLVLRVLETSRFSASGGNLQPWKVHVVSGGKLARLKEDAVEAAATGVSVVETTKFYPENLWEPYRTRRQKAALARKAALESRAGPRDSVAAEVLERNFRFFGAPVGIFFCMDDRMKPAQWTDLGIFIQSVMLMAVESGLDTCPQAIWINQEDLVRRHLSLEPDVNVIAGMAIGYRQADDPYCVVETERAPIDEFVVVHDAA